MAEDEEYDSDNSDSTVLLADFIDNPRKIDVKRRRLSTLHDRGNQTDEFDDENTAPVDASVSRRTGNSPEKKRSNVDKNWNITKYFACIDKNNDTNIKNNDSKCLQNLDFNGKQVRNDIQIKQDNMSKGNSTNIDSDEIICLDSDDETQIDDHSQDQDEISARTCINNQHLLDKPARLTTRRATTDIIEQNKTPQTEENKYPKLRVLKPCAINARRATTHFERVPNRAYTQNENKIESKGYRSTSRLPESQSADVNTSTNADCNNIGLITPDNNTRPSTLATTIQPKTDIDQSNGFIDKGPRQDTNVFLTVNTHKRCGSNNETQTEPKRIKADAKSTEPAEINKNTPNNKLKMTAVKDSGRLESSEPYGDVRNEIDLMSAEHKAIYDCVENEKSTGAVGEKAPVDTVDANTKSTVNSVEFDKTTPSKATQCAQIGLLDNLDASKTCVNVTGNKHRAVNDRIVRSDGDGETIPSDLQSTTSAVNVCENRETSDTCIIRETSESQDKKETTTKVQDVINKEQNNRMPTKVIQNQGSINLQAALDTREALDEFETERETSQVHDKQETNKAKDYPETSKPVDLVNDKHEVSKLQSGCKINETYEKQKTNKPPAKTVPNQTRHEQEAGNLLDKEKSSDKQEINKVQNDQVTIEANEPETNGVQDNHETCEHKTSDNPDMRKKQTDTVRNNTINEKESSKILEMTTTNEQEKDKEYYQLEKNNVQDEQISNEILEHETSTSENGQAEITVRENNVVEIQHRHEAVQDEQISNEILEHETSTSKNGQAEITVRESNIVEIQHRQEASNANKTTKKNDETTKANCDAGDDNSLWKFHVNFFTRLKEYFKDLYPESAKELHNRIKTIIDNRNEQVLPDLKYSCPKCSRVSNYSSRILNNVENEENKTNPDGSKTCGFCNGIRKLHNRYLKRWLAKKNRGDEEKEGVKMVSLGKDDIASVKQSRNKIVMSNSQTTSDAKIDNNLPSTSAGEDSRCCSTIDKNKLVGNYTLDQNNWRESKENDKIALELPVHNEIPTINMSQLDMYSTINNNINKATMNITTSPVASRIDTVKEVSIQDTPTTKDKLDNVYEEASPKTGLGISNKRKSDITHKEATDPKLKKAGTQETNAQSVKNLTEVSQTSDQRHETFANQRPNKIQIINIQYITSPTTANLNSSLQSDIKVNHVANSEPRNDVLMNSPEKSSNESTKEFQINTTEKNSHETCLTPKTNRDNVITTETAELNDRGKHFSEDRNQTIEGNSNENINKERQSEVDQNGNEKASTSTGCIPETNEVNVNQVRTTKENDQGNGDVLKPLMDCFDKIKNSVQETEDTVLRDQEENKTPRESSSKIRPTIRGNRSNSLDNLQNRDDNKIVMKYVCPTCTTIYVYPSKFLRHIQERHNPNLTRIPVNCQRLQCPFCRALLSNKNYNKHVKTNHPEKLNENVGSVENSNNTNKCENEKRCSMKSKTFVNRGNTENTKSSDSETNSITPDKNISTDDTTRQQKNQRRSEYKYQHLINRINIADLNKDKHDEIPGDKNQEMCPNEGDTQHISIENENHSPAAVSKGVTSNINSALPHVNHTEGCCHEPDKSSGSISAERPDTTHNEEESTPIESNVRSLRKDSMHNKNDTYHVENNDSNLDETAPGTSIASKESINNQIVDEKHNSRRVGHDECNESETVNSYGIDNYISINSANATLTATFNTENRKQGNNELSTRYINDGKRSTENTAIEGTQIRCSNINKDKETDSEGDCIKASNYTVKKRKERISKLFGDENEVSVSNKIKASNARQKQYQTPKDRDKKTERRRRKRKADVVHRRRKISVEQCTESAESSATSDSDWLVSSDESSDRSDSYDEYCTIKKQQVVRKLFSSEKKVFVLNEGNEESSTESGDNNDGSDDETIISSRYTVKKKNERLSKLFGNDSELSVSNELCQEDNRQAGRDKNGHRSDRQCVEIEEGNNESVPSNNEQEVTSDDETLKISEQTIKKKKSRISNYFGEDDEALVQDSNQQKENSDLNNSGCRIPIADDGRTKDVNVRLEDTQCRVENVEIPEMRDPRNKNENCLNEISPKDTSSRKSGIEEATDRNGNVSEGKNVNAGRNAESKSRDDDRIEIHMIDRLLKEFASDVHQNGTCADKENDNEDTRNSEINGVSQSAMVDNCLENIRITNVISVAGKTNVFICQECNYGTDAYDDAIRHCQNHYNLIEDQVTYCGICQINYEAICFERHQSNHDKYVRNIKIKFSYHWLFKNWQEVFVNNNIYLSEAEDMQVKSIYNTFCVKMAVKEDGPWQSAVYLCAKCKTCVPSFYVESHVQQQCTFVNFPCGICNRVFLTYELLKHHEIYHTDDATNIFKTIVFNDQNDDDFNSKLRQVKAQSREKEIIADIFKCLCGLCFISLGKFKLHFAYCNAKGDEGSQCPRCPGIRLFLTTELEEHLLLHHSTFNYKFRVQKITFKLESIIDSSERETPSENSNSTYNASQMTSNDEELIIKTDMLKDESLTQSATEENIQENLDANDEEDIQSDQTNETVPKTSDSILDAQTGFNDVDLIIKRDMLKDESLTQTTDEDNEAVSTTSDTTTDKLPQITLVEEGLKTLNVKRNVEQLKQICNKENGLENTDNIEKEDVNRGLINETVPEINYEDLIIKRDMLKDESLTQTADEDSETVPTTSDTTPDKLPQITLVEEGLKTLNVKRNVEQLKQICNKENGLENTDNIEKEDVNRGLLNETVPEINYEDLIIKRDMLKDESLTQTTDEDSETVPTTSDTTTDKVPQITLVEEGLKTLNVKRNVEQLTQISNGENRRENTDNVEEGGITETVPEVNHEDLIIKRDMLKEETLTQNTNEENSQEILERNEKEHIREGNSQEICAIEDSENPVDTEASEEVMAVEEYVSPINIEDSQEVNEAHGDTITIDSQEIEVEGSTHLITIEDSDEDVEFIGGSFPDTAMILPRSYYFKR